MSGDANDVAARESRPPSATPHAQPFHCPYCGLDELVPEDAPGTWFCESCARAFSLRLIEVRS